MKPRDWDELSNTDKLAAARELIKSFRGRYVLGQALAIASQVLRNSPHPWREINNAEDMEMLGFGFEPFFSMELTGNRPKTVVIGGQS
jgi:hypothetical protein